jgi:hypothetical protein
MPKVFGLRELHTNAESSFNENAGSPGSHTYDTRIPANDITLSIDQPRQSNDVVLSRQNDGKPGFNLPRTAELSFTVFWSGHVGATTGSLTETWLQELISDGLGGGDITQVGGTAGASATATDLPNTTATLVDGGIFRVGAIGDGRAEGQAAVVDDATGGSLLTALPGAANTGDVVYATQIAYPTESPSTTRRFLVGWTETGAQYHLTGCQLSSLTFQTEIGQIPTLTLTYRGAYWERSAVTIPSSSPTIESCEAAPFAGGSVFYQTAATVTRATVQPSSLTFTVDLGLQEQLGPDTDVQYQNIVGWVRTQAKPSLSMTIPWATANETPWDSDSNDTTFKHVLVTMNPADGRAVGFYMPKAYQMDPYPTATESNGLLYQTLNLMGIEGVPGTTGGDGASDLTKSAFRLFMG